MQQLQVHGRLLKHDWLLFTRYLSPPTGLRLLGIGRNQYIDLMNQCRSSKVRSVSNREQQGWCVFVGRKIALPWLSCQKAYSISKSPASLFVSLVRNSSAGSRRGTCCQPNQWKSQWSRGGLRRQATSLRMTSGWDKSFVSFLSHVSVKSDSRCVFQYLTLVIAGRDQCWAGWYCADVIHPNQRSTKLMREWCGSVGLLLGACIEIHAHYPPSYSRSSHEPLHCLWRSHLPKNKYLPKFPTLLFFFTWKH